MKRVFRISYEFCADLKELGALELVEQLTLLDQELFDPVSPADFVVWTLQPKERDTRAPKLLRFLERFGEIRSWVASTILGEAEKVDRVEVIGKFISIAEDALGCGSFNLCAAVVSGLAHPALHAIGESWLALSKEAKNSLEQVRSVCDPKDHYTAMWTAMNLWRAPCIPFVGGLIERLEQLHLNKDAGPVFITQAGAAGKEGDLVNYGRLRPMLDSAAEIRSLRATGLALKSKQQVQTLFRKLNAHDDEQLAAKGVALKETPVLNPPQNVVPNWLIPVNPSDKAKGGSSTNLLNGNSGSDHSRKQSGSVSNAALKLEKTASSTSSSSRKHGDKDMPRSPRKSTTPREHSSTDSVPPEPSVPKLNMEKVKSPRSETSVSPSSAAKLKPPSDDESPSPAATANVPAPTVAPSVVSPRPTRSGSSTMLLQLQKLEPKQGSAAAPSPKPKAAGAAQPAAVAPPRAPSPSGSSSPLGSSRDGTPPPEIPALPGSVAKKVAAWEGNAAPAAPTAAPVVVAPIPIKAAAPTAAPRSHSPPPTPKDIEKMLAESPFEDVDVIEQQLSPRAPLSSRSATSTGIVIPTQPTSPTPQMQRSQSTAEGSPSPAATSGSVAASPVSRTTSVAIPRTAIPMPDTATKEDVRRGQIVAEIRDTEFSYVGYLELLVNDGIMPLRKGNVIPDADIKTIFSNIETITGFHKIFLAEIDDVVKSWTIDQSKIGSVFEKYHQYFKLYVEFVNNFDKSNATLVRLLSKNAKMKEIQNNLIKKSGKLDFNALLIMPIQRVPRYVLLLKDLRSRTAEDHPDFEFLQKAVKSVKDISLRTLCVGSSKFFLPPTPSFSRHQYFEKGCRIKRQGS